jgi:hypothetical protein
MVVHIVPVHVSVPLCQRAFVLLSVHPPPLSTSPEQAARTDQPPVRGYCGAVAVNHNDLHTCSTCGVLLCTHLTAAAVAAAAPPPPPTGRLHRSAPCQRVLLECRSVAVGNPTFCYHSTHLTFYTAAVAAASFLPRTPQNRPLAQIRPLSEATVEELQWAPRTSQEGAFGTFELLVGTVICVFYNALLNELAAHACWQQHQQQTSSSSSSSNYYPVHISFMHIQSTVS